MTRPVLVEAAAELPVSVEKVKPSLRFDGSDLDDEIESAIKAAVSHYEGWSGVLGICLVQQTWRVEVGGFDRCISIPLRPIQSISSVKWRNSEGQLSTVAAENYTLVTDAGGSSMLIFRTNYPFPSDLYHLTPVLIEYVVGWPLDDDGAPTTPADLVTAIKMRVQMQIDEAAKTNSDNLARFEKELIRKYRAPRI